jgi:hypothetical protein
MRSGRPLRPAFRLVEVLVVAVVLMIAIGLLLPATTTGRHSNARTQCINNCRQLALAVNNFAIVHQNALPALTSDQAKPDYGAYNGGILVTLLPFLEEEVLFQHGAMCLPSCTWYAPVPPNKLLPFGTTPPDESRTPLSARPIKVYQCPYDTSIRDGYSANQAGTNTQTAPYFFPWAASSYAANYQVFGTENNLGALTSGNFCGPKYDLAHIPDGTSQTVFFGEQLAACGSTAGSLWAYPGIGNYSGPQYASAEAGAHIPVGDGKSIVNVPGVTNSYLWAPVFANDNPAFGFTAGGLEGSIARYNARERVPLVPPYALGQFWDAPPQTGILHEQCDKSRLQIFHNMAVVVSMGDGSVKLISGALSQATWYSAIMPADGNPLGLDW